MNMMNNAQLGAPERLYTPKKKPVGMERGSAIKEQYEKQLERRAKTPEAESRVAITGPDGKEYTGTVLLADAEAGTYEAVYRNDAGELVVVEQNVEQAEEAAPEAAEVKETAPEVSAEQAVEAKMEELKEAESGMVSKLKKSAGGFAKSFSKYFAAKTGSPMNEDAWFKEGEEQSREADLGEDEKAPSSSWSNVKAAVMELGVGVFEENAISKMVSGAAETVAMDIVTDKLTPGRQYLERAAKWLSDKLTTKYEAGEDTQPEAELEVSLDEGVDALYASEETAKKAHQELMETVSLEAAKLDTAVTKRRLDKLQEVLSNDELLERTMKAKETLMNQKEGLTLSERRDAMKKIEKEIQDIQGLKRELDALTVHEPANNNDNYGPEAVAA
jgi:hypothetical protein